MRKVYLVGTGIGGTASLTAEAAEAIAQADCLLGASRMLAPYADCGKPCICAYQAQEITDFLRNSNVQTAAVLLSGDCGFYSGAKNLCAVLPPEFDVTVLPGISSIAAFCARIQQSYEQIHIISLHGISANIAIPVKMHPACFFLLGGKVSAADICKRLCSYQMPDTEIWIGENLGYPNERILHGKASDLTETVTEQLSVMLTVNPQALTYRPAAIPDDSFLRSKIPMTKAEVRCNTVAALKIPHNAVCWDIGCGTGSVSVEMAYCCPEGTVYAYDKNPGAVLLTRENARQFGCDNICAAEGICPECLQNAPTPDCVMIGGSAGKLLPIFKIIRERNPLASVAVTAVSLETIAQAADAFAQYGGIYSITQIAVTRTRKIGTHTMLEAQNPVFLIAGQLSCAAS